MARLRRPEVTRGIKVAGAAAMLSAVLIGGAGTPGAGAITVRPAVLIRPVLCISGPQSGPVDRSPLPVGCPPAYGPPRVTTSAVSAGGGFPPVERRFPALARHRTTTGRLDWKHASGVVLLSAGAGTNERYLLGPAVFTLYQGQSFSTTKCSACGGWLVTIRLKTAPSGQSSPAAEWDATVCRNFHQMLAFDVNGEIVASPWIEPSANRCTPMGGSMEFLLKTKGLVSLFASALSLGTVSGQG